MNNDGTVGLCLVLAAIVVFLFVGFAAIIKYEILRDERGDGNGSD